MLEKDLSVDKIIKNLRDIKIAVKSRFLDSEKRYLIQHHQRNIIDLEEYTYLEPMQVDSVARELKDTNDPLSTLYADKDNSKD